VKNDVIQIGRRPGRLAGTLRYGEDNAVALTFLDEAEAPAEWPAPPVLEFATSSVPDAPVKYSPTASLTNAGKTATWTVPAVEIAELRGKGTCWARLRVNGETIAAGSVRVVSRWTDGGPTPGLNVVGTVAGPPGTAGTDAHQWTQGAGWPNTIAGKLGDGTDVEAVTDVGLDTKLDKPSPTAVANILQVIATDVAGTYKWLTNWEFTQSTVSTVNAMDPRWNVVEGGLGPDGRGATAGLQAAIDATPSGGILMIPAGEYWVDGIGPSAGTHPRIGGGIKPHSNMTILMDPDAVLKVIANNNPGYTAITIEAKDNVKILGGRIEGERDTHDYSIPSTHEYGLGIMVSASRDVVIDQVKISKCTGDCIFVRSKGFRQDNTEVPSERVFITRCVLDGARRNNISVVGGTTIRIVDNTITRAGYHDGIRDGTAPRFGIDLEVAWDNWEGVVSQSQTVKDVVVARNRFVGNVGLSVDNHNCEQVTMFGNWSDNRLSFGGGTETVIANNNLKDVTGVGTGISCLTGANPRPADAVIVGNVIDGFADGMDLGRHSVYVADNLITGFAAAGITFYASSNTVLGPNRIEGADGAIAGISLGGTSTVEMIGTQHIRNVTTGVEVTQTSTVALDAKVTKAYQALVLTQNSKASGKLVSELAGHASGQVHDVETGHDGELELYEPVFKGSSGPAVIAGAYGFSTGKCRLIAPRFLDHASWRAVEHRGGYTEIIDALVLADFEGTQLAPFTFNNASAGSKLVGARCFNAGGGEWTNIATVTGSTTTLAGNLCEATRVHPPGAPVIELANRLIPATQGPERVVVGVDEDGYYYDAEREF
jgi:hypothetical protein